MHLAQFSVHSSVLDSSAKCFAGSVLSSDPLAVLRGEGHLWFPFYRGCFSSRPSQSG